MSTLKLKLLLAAAVWAVVLVLLAPSAQAATKCGAFATGKAINGGETITGAFPRMFVGDNGYWYVCQPWIADGADPLTPEPKPVPKDCAEKAPPITWKAGELTCTSHRPLAATSHGTLSIALAEVGSTRGMLLQRCVDGERQLYGSRCTYHNGCDRAATINTRVGDVSVDATPQPSGTRRIGLQAERGTVDLVCMGGGWIVTRTVSK